MQPRAPQACDRGELLAALDRLSARDQRVLSRVIRRLAAIESASGEAIALAVAERMAASLRGRAAA